MCVVSTQQKVNLLNKNVIHAKSRLNCLNSKLLIQKLGVCFLVSMSVITSIKLFSLSPDNEFPDSNLQQTTADSFHLISKLSFKNISIYSSIQLVKFKRPDPSSRAVSGVDQLTLACWNCGFDSSKRHIYLSLVSVVCCQVEVPATG